VIRVRDNGIGTRPELLPHVFDMFTQADQTCRGRGAVWESD
jgi:signal transduction histidine kinase